LDSATRNNTFQSELMAINPSKFLFCLGIMV
jgi:hypothetical protein